MFLKLVLVIGLKGVFTGSTKSGQFALDKNGALPEVPYDKDIKSELCMGREDKLLHGKKLPEPTEGFHVDYAGIPQHHYLEHEMISPGKVEFLSKLLKTTFDDDLKKEELSNKELKEFISDLIGLTKGITDDTFQKEDLSEDYKEHSDVPKFIEAGIKLPILDPLHKLEDKDIKSYLAKSLEQMKFYASESTHPLMTTLKNKAAYKMEPYEKIPPQVDLKSISKKNHEAASAEEYFKVKDILMKALEDMKGASFHGKETFLNLDGLGKHHSGKDILFHESGGKEHALKDEKHFLEDKHFPEEEEDLKAIKFPHEEIMTHKKDFAYDEILKQEEAKEGFEVKEHLGVGKEIHQHFPIHGDLAKAGIDSKALSSESFLKKDISHEQGIFALDKALKGMGLDETIKDEEALGLAKEFGLKGVLKEEGIQKEKGTDTYEKARDQAHIDAKIPLIEKGDEHFADESRKKVISDANARKSTPELKHNGGILVKTEISKSIDKELIDGQISKENSHKIFEGHELAKEEKTIFENKDKEGDILKTSLHHLNHGRDIGGEELHLTQEGEFHKTLHADEENSHKKVISHKMNILHFLSRVLHMQKCFLVGMRPNELLSIINCISKSKDPFLCEKFAICEKKMPLQVIFALEKCQRETVPNQTLKCSKYEPLYPSAEVPVKIFQCVVKNTKELHSEEKKQMIDFEECARQVKLESCGRIPWG